MLLKHIFLQNFRSYEKQTFYIDPRFTIVAGPNTCGKTNFLEAVYFLATGKSFRTDKDAEAVQFEKQVARISGKTEEDELEVVLQKEDENKAPYKKYLVNKISKRRVDFAGHLVCVLFSPNDLEIIIDGPSYRRNFLDEVLEQVDRDYRIALAAYTKALRQRNALLSLAREQGRRNEKQFEYWDELLVGNGQIISAKREAFINFLNSEKKIIFDFEAVYDKSVISKDRLLQYQDAELSAGVTLVGPHRDDLVFLMNVDKDVQSFASRGQQRLVVLQLKLLQLSCIRKAFGFTPLLLLDDIFSELDDEHIHLVLDTIQMQQTILTTTHKEFVPKAQLQGANVIELEKE